MNVLFLWYPVWRLSPPAGSTVEGVLSNGIMFPKKITVEALLRPICALSVLKLVPSIQQIIHPSIPLSTYPSSIHPSLPYHCLLQMCLGYYRVTTVTSCQSVDTEWAVEDHSIRLSTMAKIKKCNKSEVTSLSNVTFASAKGLLWPKTALKAQ